MKMFRKKRQDVNDMKKIIKSLKDIVKRESFKNVILIILTLLALWAVIAIEFYAPLSIKTCISDNKAKALNSFFLTLSYSYIAALVFYAVTCALPLRQRRNILEPIIKGKILGISRCIRDILLEFSRETNYGHNVHNIQNTEAILKSKNWFAIVPMIQQYHKASITYLRYMGLCGENMRSQIDILIVKYHVEMTASQLLELENLADAMFFHTIDRICSMPDSSIAESGYDSLVKEFIKLQEQYLKVEKEFGICLNE